MLRPDQFRDIVSGRREGIGASAIRGLLRIAEVPYTLAVNWRNRRYDGDGTLVHRVGVPVVSVGNLTLGGTGKTPMVKWLARWLQQRGVRVALVSRGYGAEGREQGARSREQDTSNEPSHSPLSAPNRAPTRWLPAYNDEALELAQSLPDVPHVQNPNRVAGATRAIHEFNCRLVLLDDGFQHRRLARDLDIVLLDALEPFGFDHVFPRGTLREPVAGLRRAKIVCLSRADTLAPAERDAIRRRAKELAPNAIWCELAHAASRLVNTVGDSQPLDTLAGRRVAAFCGVGNPSGFQHTLAAIGCMPTAWRAFPDHHHYTAADVSALCDLVAESQAELAVCTQKDLVKLRRGEIGDAPLWAVEIELQFLSGQELFERALQCAIRQETMNDEG